MVLNIQLTPLYGVHTDSPALATLLSLDGLNILLDCGWNAFYDPTFLSNLAKVAPTVHVVLLSHSDPAHLGALPFAVAKFGLDAIIFATLPVWRMGQMAMYDVFLSHDAQAPFTLFNLDDVDAAFEYSSDPSKSRFRLLKYQQHFPLDALPNGARVVITPHRSAHLLGGTVWSIKKGTQTLVYAVHFNHRKERHLNPTTLASFSRPSHLIVSATNAMTHTEARGPSDLISAVTTVVGRRGNVLIPTDTAGRLLEVAAVLHEAWERTSSLRSATLVVLHPLSARTLEFARSMIEWMSDEVVKRFDISRENLFTMQHIRLVQTLEDLDAIRGGPLVVLSSASTLEMGFSRHLFARWADDSRNMILLPTQPEAGTLGARLHSFATTKRKTDAEPFRETLVLRKKELLRGEELEQWRESERARKTREREQKEREAAAARAVEEKAEAEKRAAEEAAAASALAESSMTDSGEPRAQRFELDVLAFLRGAGITRAVRAETFEYERPKMISWDHYGQKVDAVRYIIGEDPGEGGLSGEENVGGLAVVEEDEEEIPTKYVEESVDVVVRCEVVAVDCAGLSDGDSLKRLLKEVEARHVTVIGGTKEETAHLGEHLRKTMSVGGRDRRNKVESEAMVSIPQEMEMVDVTSDMAVWQLSLADALVRGVAWDEVGLSRIGFVDAMVTDEVDERDIGVLGQQEVVEKEADEVIGNEGHGTYFIGTVMLNKLKDKLDAAGVKAEFAGGALCVENGKTGVVVVVRKVGTQHIVMEGAFSEEYITVRDVLYNELVIPT